MTAKTAAFEHEISFAEERLNHFSDMAILYAEIEQRLLLVGEPTMAAQITEKLDKARMARDLWASDLLKLRKADEAKFEQNAAEFDALMA